MPQFRLTNCDKLLRFEKINSANKNLPLKILQIQICVVNLQLKNSNLLIALWTSFRA